MAQKVLQFYIMKQIDVNFLNIVQLIKHFDLHDTCSNEYMKVWLTVTIKKKTNTKWFQISQKWSCDVYLKFNKSNEFELMLTNDIRFKETTDLPERQVF